MIIKENDKCVGCGYSFWEHTSKEGCPVKVYKPIENPKFKGGRNEFK